MRLGGPTFGESDTPEKWIAQVQRQDYRAAYCPVTADQPADVIQAYEKAARAADIVIAEVGAWSNPLSKDEKTRLDAITFCEKQLALADTIGARCCVNITGSRGPKWDGPCAEDLTPATFDLIVETVRTIIDAVKPTRSFYAIETMPWMYPDSPDSYLQLLKTIDRPQLAVHLDPVNIVSSPQRFFNNAALIRECFAKLGPWIQSCHAKDIALGNKLTVHLDEVCPGLGGLDYRVYLTELAKLPADTTLMLEHLRTEVEYAQAATHIRNVAKGNGILL